MTSDDKNAPDDTSGVDESSEPRSDSDGPPKGPAGAPDQDDSQLNSLADDADAPAPAPAPEAVVDGDADSKDAEPSEADPEDDADPEHDADPEDDDESGVEDAGEGGLSAFIAASEAATRAETERDEGPSIWGGDEAEDDEEDPGYVEVRRSAPGWAMSRWIISAGVAAAVIILSFIMIPKLFTPEDPASAAGSSTTPTAAPTTTAAPVVTYPDVVLASGPTHYWKFEMQAAGSDSVGAATLNIGPEVAVLGSSAYKGGLGAIDCSGTAKSRALSSAAETPAGDFSVEVWINTVTTDGGPIVTFGNKDEGTSSKLDRVMYMATNGKVYFGTFDESREYTISDLPVNTGTWRHLVGTMSATTGLTFYVDGKAVATEEAGTSTNDFEGYWKVCGDNTASWPGNSGKPAFTGTVDDVAIYAKALTAQEVLAHYQAVKSS